MTGEIDVPGKSDSAEPKVTRDPVADKLASLLEDPAVLKAVAGNPDSLSARILIEANAISLNSDLLEEEAGKSSE